MNDSMNRRGFLGLGAGAVLAAPALGWLDRGSAHAQGSAAPAAPQAPSARKIKKAVGIGMVGDGKTLLEKFTILRDLGFDGVELNRPGGEKIEEVLKARDASGIAIANVVDSVHWGQTLSDPDANIRKKGREGLEAAMRDAQSLGCKTVLLVPAVVNDRVSYADAYVRSQEEIRLALPLAKELGVYICIENVWNQFLLSPLEAARYVDELQSPWVGFHFDVGNIINYGWPEQWIRVLGSRIKNLHIKEYSRKKRDNEGLWKGFDVDLLDGDNNWPAVMKALDEIGYEGWAVAEIAGGDRARLKVVAERMDKINKL